MARVTIDLIVCGSKNSVSTVWIVAPGSRTERSALRAASRSALRATKTMAFAPSATQSLAQAVAMPEVAPTITIRCGFTNSLPHQTP